MISGDPLRVASHGTWWSVLGKLMSVADVGQKVEVTENGTDRILKQLARAVEPPFTSEAET